MSVLWQAVLLGLVLVVWKAVASVPNLVAWVQLERLPHAPRKLLLGNMVPGAMRLAQPHLTWFKMHKELGGLFCIRLAWRHMVMITDPAMAEQLIQISSDKQIDKLRGPYKNFQMLSDPDHPSMFTSPTDTYWHTVRKGLAPAFNTANIRQGFGNIADIMQTVVQFLKDQGPHAAQDVDIIAARAALDAISRTGFGYNMDCCSDLAAPPEKTPYFHALDASVQAVRKWMLVPWFLRYFSFLSVVKKDMAAIRQLRQLNMQLLKRLQANPPPPQTLGAHMLKLTDPSTGQPLTDQQLLGEITIMYMAGWDTSAHTIAFTCGLIATHPEAEQRIADELDGLGLLASPSNPEPRRISHDDLALLSFTSAVIKESMRMFPVGAFGTVRTSQQPLRLGGHYLPAHTALCINFYSIFNSPDYWDKPEQFMPDRWLEPGAEYAQSPASGAESQDGSCQTSHSEKQSAAGTADDTAHLGSAPSSSGQQAKRYFPFSQGLRNCIGQNLARMTVLTFVASLCSHFRLRMHEKMGGLEGMRSSQRMSLTLKPGAGMHLHFIPRASLSAVGSAAA